jgi:hypothetical protein
MNMGRGINIRYNNKLNDEYFISRALMLTYDGEQNHVDDTEMTIKISNMERMMEEQRHLIMEQQRMIREQEEFIHQQNGVIGDFNNEMNDDDEKMEG